MSYGLLYSKNPEMIRRVDHVDALSGRVGDSISRFGISQCLAKNRRSSWKNHGNSQGGLRPLLKHRVRQGMESSRVPLKHEWDMNGWVGVRVFLHAAPSPICDRMQRSYNRTDCCGNSESALLLSCKLQEGSLSKTCVSRFFQDAARWNLCPKPARKCGVREKWCEIHTNSEDSWWGQFGNRQWLR